MTEPIEKPPSGESGPLPTEAKPVLSQPRFSFAERTDPLFIGPEGLRSGWRLLLYLGMRKALYVLLGIGVYYIAQSAILDLWTDLVAEIVFLAAAVIPAFIMARLEHRRFDVYGFPRRQAFGKLFWLGSAWGLAAITLLMLAMHGVGVFDFGKLALHGPRILEFAAFWGLFYLIVGFAEEFYLRGYTQFTLTQTIGFWPAAVVLSIAFGAIHYRNPGETVPGLVAAACIGLFFCLTLRRTGSLWFAVGFHAAWDWGESYLYSVPDSGTVSPGHLLRSSLHGPAWLTGGSVGPEGSIFLFVTIIVLWVAFDRVYREAKYGAPNQIEIGSAD